MGDVAIDPFVDMACQDPESPAWDLLLRQYRRLFHRFAGRYATSGTDSYDDMIAECHVGLMTAVESYPRTTARSFTHHLRFTLRHHLYSVYCATAFAMRMDRKTLAARRRDGRGMLTLESLDSENDHGATPLDRLADPESARTPAPDLSLFRETLSDDQQRLLIERFVKEKSLEAIGRDRGCSKSAAHRQIDVALETVRRAYGVAPPPRQTRQRIPPEEIAAVKAAYARGGDIPAIARQLHRDRSSIRDLCHRLIRDGQLTARQ